MGAIAVDDIVDELCIPDIDDVADAACDVVDDVAEPQPVTVSASAIVNAPRGAVQARRNVCIERPPEREPTESGNYTRDRGAHAVRCARWRLRGQFGIRSIPTLMVLRDGEPIAAQAGVISAEGLLTALDRIADASAAADSQQAA